MALQIVTPGYVRMVKGEGMPKSKQPGQKGDLRIAFDVQVSAAFKYSLVISLVVMAQVGQLQ